MKQRRWHVSIMLVTRIAVEEKYPKIAYLFNAFAVSEKIHAVNYEISYF
jgi:rubrerythrin